MNKSKQGENKFYLILTALSHCLWLGVKQLWRSKLTCLPYLFSIGLMTFTITVDHRFLWNSHYGIGKELPRFLNSLFYQVPWGVWFFLFMITQLFVWVLLAGIKDFKQRQEMQRKLEIVGLKGADGSYFKILAVNKHDEFKTTVVIKSVGIGIEKYQQKKSDIESSLAEELDSVTNGANPQIVIMHLTKRKLPTLVKYSDLEAQLLKPHSFIIGESMKGVVTRTLESLPHLLIAGTTGGGKSVFFKQMLLSLMKTTPRLQLYLLDLKRGVEMKEFSELPNVRIAKSEAEAAQMLKMIKEEMDRRFVYLEKIGKNEIVPERDKMDKIVVGIDEASVLYSKAKSNPSKTHLINLARDYTDELAKLARAAGIHLIFATQKVSKETLDTRVQENIGGRVCFRMNTMTNSVTVLGNKMAFELPDVKGRAIWASGNDFMEIQAPFVEEELLKSEIESINEKFTAKYPCFNPMINFGESDDAEKTNHLPDGN